MEDLTPRLQAAVADHQAGRLDEAVNGYREILAAQPDHADALHLLGLIAFQTGRLDDALKGVERAIAINDGVAMFHANRGRILKARGDNAAAAEAFARALRLQPGEPSTLSDLAGALVDSGDADAAMHFACRAAELAPEMAAAHYNQGLASARLGETRSARAAFEQAVAVDPAFAPAHFELGRLYHEEGDLEKAEACYRRTLEIDAAQVEALTNLGNVLRATYRLEDAVACYRQALAGAEDVAAIHGNLGVALQELGDTGGALAAYDAALELDPEDAETQRNRAQALLQTGRFQEGWAAFEWRWKTHHFAAIRRDWEMVQWDGGEGKDGSVLVHSEQGFGDCIQFARYLPLVAARVGRVIVECPAPMAGLMGGVPGVHDVIAAGTPLPAFDAHVPMMSLPGLFETDLDNLPAAVPYLSVAPETVAAWRERTGAPDEFKVGLAWKGSHMHQRNRWRSPGLMALEPLLAVPGVRFVSLQKDDEAADLKARGLTETVLPLGQEFRNFIDTAAAIENLDLVIAPDTAVAHLAGALAKPVWLVLPHVAEWRWLMDRDDSPWYPTMRLFRQETRGDWQGPVDRMAALLAPLAAGATSSS